MINKSNTCNNINIFIPKIDNTITKIQLKNIFISIFKEQCINNIIFIKNNKTRTTMVYIYLKYWPSNKLSCSVKNKLINRETIKIVYNYPNYLKCLLKK
jgi:hypothetical protein